MSLSNGVRLGPYEIVASVGAGGMGEVYRARDARLGREVAIKILPASLAENADRLRRFEQEARAVAALNHPNILTVYDVGTTPAGGEGAGGGAAAAPAGSPYLVTELLEGSSLREKLGSGPLPPRKVIDYATQIARGLAAAHERGIVHRDLKPDNIYVTTDGRVKILDFGLAKLTEANVSEETHTIETGTQPGVVMGTIGYMSPEQVRGRPADARSDIFSFGAVLYEMVSGRRAFQGDSTADVMSSILKEDPPELSLTSGTVAPALDHIIRRCLEKEPQQRFQSAGDLAFHIAELSGTGMTSPMSGASAAIPERKETVRYAVAAAVAVAVLAGTWFMARSTVEIAPARFQRVTYQQGNVSSARFLPDGQSIVASASWNDDKNISLYTGRLDSPGMRPMDVEARNVASVSSAGEMAILQNMQAVGPGYAAAGTLSRMPLGGGAPRPILESAQYADWGPDGTNMAVVRFVPATHMYRLEYPVGKLQYETSGWISDPRVSHDGKKIAFLDHPVFGDDMGYVSMLEIGGKPKVVSDKYVATQGLAWSPNDKEIWFSASSFGPSLSIMATNAKGKVRALLDAPGSLQIQDVAPDGRILVVQRDTRRVLKVSTPDGSKERDYSWLDWSYDNIFSADGKFVVFGDQDAGQNYGVFMRSMSGGLPTRLGDGDPQDVSPDGQWVISRMADPQVGLVLLPIGAGDPRQLSKEKKVEHRLARFTPDGQHVLVIGNEKGHPERTFLLDLNGNERPITPEGVSGRVPTRDSKGVLVRRADKSYAIQKFEGGPLEPVPQLKVDDYAMKYSADGSAVYVVRFDPDDRQAAEIWSVSIPSGKRELLHKIKGPNVPGVSPLGFITVSLDGKAYAYQYSQSTATVYVVKGVK